MKAQVSNEFLIFVLILVIIISIFSSSSLSFKNQLTNIRIQTEAKRLADYVASEINLAAEVGEGYERRFYVENSFAGITEFSIEVSNYSLFLEWRGGTIYSPLVVPLIHGKIKKGWNTIRNVGGEVYVE